MLEKGMNKTKAGSAWNNKCGLNTGFNHRKNLFFVINKLHMDRIFEIQFHLFENHISIEFMLGLFNILFKKIIITATVGLALLALFLFFGFQVFILDFRFIKPNDRTLNCFFNFKHVLVWELNNCYCSELCLNTIVLL